MFEGGIVIEDTKAYFIAYDIGCDSKAAVEFPKP